MSTRQPRRGQGNAGRLPKLRRQRRTGPAPWGLPNLTPMLATPGALPGPAEDAQWGYETKWDGARLLAFVDGGRVRLRSRNDLDVTVSYPELAGLAGALGASRAVLDGEVVAFGAGRPAQLRPAAAADARRPAPRGAAAQRHRSGPVPGLRRAAPGRPGHRRAALLRAPHPAGRPGPRRRRLAVPALLRRQRGPELGAARQPGTGPGGGGGQAAGQQLPAGPPIAGLAQDQEHPDAGGGRPRLAAGQRPPGRHHRLAAGRRAGPGRRRIRDAALRRQGGHRLHRGGAGRPAPAGCSRSPGVPRRWPARHRGPRRPARSGSSRCWSARSASASGRRTAGCGTRSGVACGRTSRWPRCGPEG